jgi:hypothetical protein
MLAPNESASNLCGDNNSKSSSNNNNNGILGKRFAE